MRAKQAVAITAAIGTLNILIRPPNFGSSKIAPFAELSFMRAYAFEIVLPPLECL